MRVGLSLKVLPAVILTLGALGAAISQRSDAHHAFAAEFDADKPLEVEGIVTKIKWVNPHSWLYFDVVGKDGTPVNWGVEFGAPNQLSRIGLTKADVIPGEKIRIKGYLAKNGGPFGYSVTVTLADGRVFQTGGAQDAPTGNRTASR